MKEGRIKIYQTPPEGDAITLDVLDPGEFFGAVNWENNDAHLNVTAEALTEAVVGVVPVKNFQYFLKRKPHLAMPPQRTLGSFIKRHLRWRSAESENYNLVTSCQKQRRGMTNPFLNIAFRSPASRLALLLQNCAETPERGGTAIGHGSKRVPHKLSTKRLAQLIGSSDEKMEALLNQFKQHGIIKKRFRRIQILDPWRLKRLPTQEWHRYRPKLSKIKRTLKLMSKKNPYLQIDQQMVGDIYTSQEVMDNLTVLCDEYGARFAGTPEEYEAANFIAACFKRYGLQNVKLETYPYAGWTRGTATLEVLEPIRRTLHCISLPYCPAADITTELVSAGYGSPDEYSALGDTATDTLVMAKSASPPDLGRWVHRKEKFERAVLAGASGFIFVSEHPGVGT